MPRLLNAASFEQSETPQLLAHAHRVVTRELERTKVLQAGIEVLHDRLRDCEQQQQQQQQPSQSSSENTTTTTTLSVPRFDAKEVVLGRVLGRGAFGVVRQITSIRLPRPKTGNIVGVNGPPSRRSWFGFSAADSNGLPGRGSMMRMSFTRFSRRTCSSESEISETPREQLARRAGTKKRNGGRYVVKQISTDLLRRDRVTYLKGVIDIALETYYLASLDHPHILKLRGTSMVAPYSVSYFIILDQLHEILTSKLGKWMQISRAATGITGCLTGGTHKQKSLLIERLLVVRDIAEALDYIHGKDIIFRDLKPDNIGFDQEGTLKVFDFGLAKELVDEERDFDNPTRFHMTKFTGAIRYMAPEVGLGRPYNLKADVYSWAMLFWYVMALEPPMGMYTPKMFIDRVFQRGYRPDVQDEWPKLACDLMRSSWSNDIDCRPDFRFINDTLLALMVQINPTQCHL